MKKQEVKYTVEYKGEIRIVKYSRETATLRFVTKATEQELEDDREWQNRFGKDLWIVDDEGYVEVDCIGLSRESWDDVEERENLIEYWFSMMEEEIAQCISEFI